MDEPSSTFLSPKLRWTIYGLLIVASCSTMIGRIMLIKSDSGKTPFLSANDRSRWSTVRALGDHNTYQIDSVIFSSGKNRDKDWYTIDMVRHLDRDGKEHFYSSKPTLFPTMLAYEYLAIKTLTGKSLAENPMFVARLMLVLTNVLPLAVGFIFLGLVLDRFAATDWARIYVMGCATFGTFLTTFAVTLNNHVIAGVSVMIASYFVLKVCDLNRSNWISFFMIGVASTFTAANELPALSFFAICLIGCSWISPRQTILGFLPGSLIVMAGFFGTNWTAHQGLKPPYMHRDDGAIVATVEGDFSASLDAGKLPVEIQSEINRHSELFGIVADDETSVEIGLMPTADDQSRWVAQDPNSDRRMAITSVDGSQVYSLHEWGNWYDYDRSYWRIGTKTGIDLGEPSRFAYAFHLIVGHHGIFSLTPIWLIAVWGAFASVRSERSALRYFGVAVLSISVICVAFYIARPMEDRNYGGVTSGLRWLFWFAPMWLICMIPAADRIAGRRGLQICALLLLVASAASALYSGLNPWSHPWLYTLLAPTP